MGLQALCTGQFAKQNSLVCSPILTLNLCEASAIWPVLSSNPCLCLKNNKKQQQLCLS